MDSSKFGLVPSDLISTDWLIGTLWNIDMSVGLSIYGEVHQTTHTHQTHTYIDPVYGFFLNGEKRGNYIDEEVQITTTAKHLKMEALQTDRTAKHRTEKQKKRLATVHSLAQFAVNEKHI